jgi:serine protease Do
MNTNWKNAAVALAAMMALTSATAQKKDKNDKDKKKSQTITIVRSGDATEKITVEVDGDKVTVNGKPIEEFKSDDIQVVTGVDKFRMLAPGQTWTGKFPGATGQGLFELDKFMSWGNNGMLGVSAEDGEGGAKVTEVTKESAAEKAGLKTGDIITKVNDVNVADADDLPAAISKFKPEEKVTITYKRDGKESTASATLDKNAHSFSRSFDIKDHDFKDHDFNFNFDKGVQGYNLVRKPRLGLQVEDLQEGNGVKVLDVNNETPAAKAGLQKDDVITSFNGKEIKSVDDIRAAMKDLKEGDSVQVAYKRAGSSQTADIKFPKAVKKASI